MTDGFGYTFAPTTEQPEMGERRGGLAGIPEAIRVLGLRLPRVLGARAPSPTASQDTAGGMDPYGSALAQTLARLMGTFAQANAPGHLPPGQIPPTNAGPNRGPVRVPGLPPSVPDYPSPPVDLKTRTHWQGEFGVGGPRPATPMERVTQGKWQDPDARNGWGQRPY